jgi:hypothetical protein
MAEEGFNFGGISSALGTIGSIYSSIETGQYRKEVLNLLSEILNQVTELEKELQALSAKIDLNDLDAKMGEADVNIDKWYSQHASLWFNGTAPASELDPDGFLATGTKDVCNSMLQTPSWLDSIHVAIINKDDMYPNAWLELEIQSLILSDQNQWTNSVVDLAYRYWLRMITIQTRGLMCMVAINHKSVADYANRLNNRIPVQGAYNQDNVVKSYLSNHLFTWFGMGTKDSDGIKFTNSAKPDEGSYKTIGYGVNSAPSGTAVTNVGFAIIDGFQVETSINYGTVTVDGITSNQKTQYTPISNNMMNICTVVDAHNTIQASNDVLTIPSGGIISSVQLKINQSCYNDSAGDELCTNTFYLSVGYRILHPNGSLSDEVILTQDPSKFSNAAYRNASLGIIGNGSTPLTNLQLVNRGSQLAFSASNTIHVNGFTVPPVKYGDTIALYNNSSKKYMAYDKTKNAIVTAPTPASGQQWKISLVSDGKSTDQAKYGDIVTFSQTNEIQATTNPLSAPNADDYEVDVAASDATTQWIIVNPFDETSTDLIYASSQIVFRNVSVKMTDGSDGCLTVRSSNTTSFNSDDKPKFDLIALASENQKNMGKYWMCNVIVGN